WLLVECETADPSSTFFYYLISPQIESFHQKFPKPNSAENPKLSVAMAISSSSGSNFIDYPSSPSSSSSSASSLNSISESREPTPEYDPTAAYEALAPLHWDAEEFDFGNISEDDEHKTDGEDLRLLFQEEPESGSDEGFSWDGV